jgi:hypothetical protein
MPDCLIGADAAPDAIPIHALSPETLDGFLDGEGAAIAGFARAAGFKAAAGSLLAAPREGGVGCLLFGLGKDLDRPPLLPGRLATALPAGDYSLSAGFPDDGLARREERRGRLRRLPRAYQAAYGRREQENPESRHGDAGANTDVSKHVFAPIER